MHNTLSRRYTLFLLLIFLGGGLIGQTDSTVILQGITITEGRDSKRITSTTPIQVIDQKSIRELPVVQLPDVLKLFSGVSIKDYGGTGGMKTVSVRGFGAQHTAVAYDGVMITDCQTGQIDLSKFSLHNIAEIALINGFDDNLLLPARLLSTAAIIEVKTLEPTFQSGKPINLDFSFTGGSFGYLNPTLRIENLLYQRPSKHKTTLTSSFSINYLQSKGDYPFTIYYGAQHDSTSVERRQNSDIRSLTLEENLFFHFGRDSKMNIKLYYLLAERGLPGAVIFYNTAARQRLTDQNAWAQIDYENRFHAQFAYRVQGKFNFAYQRYFDPEYLNAAGFLDNTYYQRELYLSNTFLYVPHPIFSLSLSNDLIYNNMSANTADFAFPQRYSVLTTLSGLIDTRFVDIRLGLLHTFVENTVKQGEAAGNTNRLSPSAGISIKPILSEDFVIRCFYKNIFRLPTFNDLYYRLVGNVALNPENTHQFDLGVAYSRSFMQKKMHVQCQIDGYHNRVTDKIIAIPNKNLFVWTMLNLGEVAITGVEMQVNYRYDITHFLSWDIMGSYSFRHAIDITDPSSKSYQDQIPYTPLHSGSVSTSIRTTYVDIIYTLLCSGERFTLPQNEAENRLPAYCDHSISICKDFNIKKITLGGKVELLNLSNKHYEIVKNYPMQGRSFRVCIHLRW